MLEKLVVQMADDRNFIGIDVVRRFHISVFRYRAEVGNDVRHDGSDRPGSDGIHAEISAKIVGKPCGSRTKLHE